MGRRHWESRRIDEEETKNPKKNGNEEETRRCCFPKKASAQLQLGVGLGGAGGEDLGRDVAPFLLGEEKSLAFFIVLFCWGGGLALFSFFLDIRVSLPAARVPTVKRWFQLRNHVAACQSSARPPGFLVLIPS